MKINVRNSGFLTEIPHLLRHVHQVFLLSRKTIGFLLYVNTEKQQWKKQSNVFILFDYKWEFITQ
jgi:hypothetical protein